MGTGETAGGFVVLTALCGVAYRRGFVVLTALCGVSYRRGGETDCT